MTLNRIAQFSIRQNSVTSLFRNPAFYYYFYLFPHLSINPGTRFDLG